MSETSTPERRATITALVAYSAAIERKTRNIEPFIEVLEEAIDREIKAAVDKALAETGQSS